MKIAITADVHLSEKGKYPPRYNALKNILEQIKAVDINTLIIAGDLFNKDFNNYPEFEDLCNEFPNIHLHIIPGNHDAGINNNNIVADNVDIYDAPTVADLDSVPFLFIPYEDKATMSEKISEQENEIKGKQWVLVAHGDYHGGVKEINPLEPGTYMPLSKKYIQRLKPKTVFLGHIHKQLNWDNIYYPGSPCGLDISETGKRTFLVYDTANDTADRKTVETDVLYFQETFLIVPINNEIQLLKQQIKERIESWDIDSSDYSKVCVRIQAKGYTTNKNEIYEILKDEFDGFKYYDDGPNIDDLSISSDTDLDEIANHTIKLIENDLDWDFGGNEPDKEQIKIAALKVIYGD
ncbi:MAG: metallophosphoesterase family protein [Planctomycetota bacterium]|jgi:DNA repair exonuclease SbcCD nuclease subunit